MCVEGLFNSSQLCDFVLTLYCWFFFVVVLFIYCFFLSFFFLLFFFFFFVFFLPRLCLLCFKY